MNSEQFYWYWHAIIIIAYLVLLYYIKTRRTELKFNTNITRQDVKLTAKLLLFSILLLVISASLGLLRLQPITINLRFILIILFYGLLITLPEEAFFRGILQHYTTKKIGLVWGIIAASILFGLAHLPNGATGLAINLLNWKLALMASLGGIIFGYSYHKTKSIIHPIILHTILGLLYFFAFNGGRF